jgi:hypothetical protein
MKTPPRNREGKEKAREISEVNAAQAAALQGF